MTTKQIELLLLARDFRFVKSLGQNFLMDEKMLSFIADGAKVQGENVLEIGAGAGCLTKELAARANKVLAIEIDKNLIPVLETVLAGYSNVTILQADALRTKLEALCLEVLGPSFVVAANLPYGITTQVMQLLFSMKGATRITVMLQEEAVDRILCGPGSKEYGPISILREYLFDAQVLGYVPPGAFLPRPQVDSAILSLSRKQGIDEQQEHSLRRIVKAAFAMRRKTLHNNLSAIFGKQRAGEVIEEAGLSPTVRAEALSLSDFLALSRF